MNEREPLMTLVTVNAAMLCGANPMSFIIDTRQIHRRRGFDIVIHRLRGRRTSWREVLQTT